MPKIDDDPAPNGAQLALNVADLTRIPQAILPMLLGGKLGREPIRMDRQRPDEVGAVLTCDLLTAACVADTIREHDRRSGDAPCRAYLRRGAWRKLPGGAKLTVMRDGKAFLNPEVFGGEAGGDPLPPPPRKVVF